MWDCIYKFYRRPVYVGLYSVKDEVHNYYCVSIAVWYVGILQ